MTSHPAHGQSASPGHLRAPASDLPQGQHSQQGSNTQATLLLTCPPWLRPSPLEPWVGDAHGGPCPHEGTEAGHTWGQNVRGPRISVLYRPGREPQAQEQPHRPRALLSPPARLLLGVNTMHLQETPRCLPRVLGQLQTASQGPAGGRNTPVCICRSRSEFIVSFS